MKRRPTAVDLFAGAGGLSLGLEQAGFDVVACVERDPVHAAVHHFNFPKTKTLTASVTDVSGADLLDELGLKTVDLVAGGAPCQGFSMIGQRALEDPRNALVSEFVRLVVELDASYFVFENVKGLTIGKHRKFLRELYAEFEKHGYQVRSPWRVLNASYYGVPQSRERLFLIGARKGLELPCYPRELNGGQETPPTCEDALADLPNADEFEALIHSDEVAVEFREPTSAYARFLRGIERESNDYSFARHYDTSKLTASARTRHTEVTRNRFNATPKGSIEPISRFFKLAPDGISNTLRAGTDSSRGAFTSPRPIHYRFDRCVTVREMARLHSFPDWFRFHRTKWHGAREVGNSVPPNLARAIGSALMDAMGLQPHVPSEVLRLGDPSLLGLTVQQASDYWGIKNPISGRTSKGSYSKRTQA